MFVRPSRSLTRTGFGPPVLALKTPANPCLCPHRLLLLSHACNGRRCPHTRPMPVKTWGAGASGHQSCYDPSARACGSVLKPVLNSTLSHWGQAARHGRMCFCARTCRQRVLFLTLACVHPNACTPASAVPACVRAARSLSLHESSFCAQPVNLLDSNQVKQLVVVQRITALSKPDCSPPSTLLLAANILSFSGWDGPLGRSLAVN